MAIMPIERGKIREYATATAAARPAYLDDPKAPVPPTFLATVVFWTPIGETLRSPEVLRACAEAGVTADLGSLLSLEQEYVYHGPAAARGGDAADRRAADRHHREADPRRPGDGGRSGSPSTSATSAATCARSATTRRPTCSGSARP